VCGSQQKWQIRRRHNFLQFFVFFASDRFAITTENRVCGCQPMELAAAVV